MYGAHVSDALNNSRLGRVLADRGAPIAPILAAIEVARAPTVYVAASGLTPRIDLLLPFRHEALAEIAPNIHVAEIPPRAMLRISANGDVLDAAMVVVGAVPPEVAIDDAAPATGRSAWRPIVDALLTAGGGLTSRTRFLTDPHGAIAMRFAGADRAFEAAIEAIAQVLGTPEADRVLWRKLHTSTDVTVATQCGPIGPTPELGFLYRYTQWDAAIDLARSTGNTALARSVALAFGALAGILGTDEISGVEVLLGGAQPDLVVWTTIRSETP